MQKTEVGRNPFNSLAVRELQVAICMYKGMKTKDIAFSLEIKSNTVSTMKRNIYFKLGVSNFVDFFKLALINNLN